MLDAVLRAGGLDPDAVHRVTIGFGAVPALVAGGIDAATAFWNAEGVTLERQGVPIRVFRVDDYGAPSYPELVLGHERAGRSGNGPGWLRRWLMATRQGYVVARDHPGTALGALAAANPSLDQRGGREAELRALDAAHAFTPHLPPRRPQAHVARGLS